MAISKEQMKDMYVKMRRIRDFESTAARLFAEGKIPGFVHLYLGEEAIAPAVCECLRDDDFITSTHRGHGHIIAKGGDLNLMMAELFGRETGYCKGKGGSMHIADRDKGILGANGIVGAGHCISTGAGLSAKIRGTDQVCVCFFGDGSTNQGTFHESLNMASIWKLPIIFVCENNHYGISMSQDRHQAIKDVADRGAAYNIPGIAVDGNDALAVYEAAAEAVARARAGKGPTLHRVQDLPPARPLRGRPRDLQAQGGAGLLDGKGPPAALCGLPRGQRRLLRRRGSSDRRPGGQRSGGRHRLCRRPAHTEPGERGRGRLFRHS